jgi:hypothetical protein
MHGQDMVIESRNTGDVAQLGERRVRNAKVEGSIPFTGTNQTIDLYDFLVIFTERKVVRQFLYYFVTSKRSSVSSWALRKNPPVIAQFRYTIQSVVSARVTQTS